MRQVKYKTIIYSNNDTSTTNAVNRLIQALSKNKIANIDVSISKPYMSGARDHLVQDIIIVYNDLDDNISSKILHATNAEAVRLISDIDSLVRYCSDLDALQAADRVAKISDIMKSADDLLEYADEISSPDIEFLFKIYKLFFNLMGNTMHNDMDVLVGLGDCFIEKFPQNNYV